MIKIVKKGMKQKVLNYTAIFEPAEEGGFNVHFSALPGCVTFGKDLKHARKMAREALDLWLETMIEMRGKIPVEKQKPTIDSFRVFMPTRS